MQFRSILLSAFAAGAMAVPENQKIQERQLDPNNFASSFVGALLTAAPEVIFSVATLPSASATAAIESALYGAASGFPTWYTALPTDIQSYLSVNDPRKLGTTVIPSDSVAIPTTTPASVSSVAINGTIISSAAGNLTSSILHSVTGSTTTRTASGSATRASTSASASSTAGAAVPTAVIGSGVMGVVALFGVLAL